MIAFTRPSTTAMIASGSEPDRGHPDTTCVATHTEIATTMKWIRNPPLFDSPDIGDPPSLPVGPPGQA